MSVDSLVAQVHPTDRWRQLGMKPHQPDVTSSDEQWHSGEISNTEVTDFSVSSEEVVPAVVAAAFEAHRVGGPAVGGDVIGSPARAGGIEVEEGDCPVISDMGVAAM